MSWIYSQKSGVLRHDANIESAGYSGKGNGKNNPDMQNVHNVGPIPQGTYQIGTAHDSDTHGPFVLPLSPSMENTMFGRSGFLIHGDSLTNPGGASEGCIIMDRNTRDRIAASLDNELQVTA